MSLFTQGYNIIHGWNQVFNLWAFKATIYNLGLRVCCSFMRLCSHMHDLRFIAVAEVRPSNAAKIWSWSSLLYQEPLFTHGYSSVHDSIRDVKVLLSKAAKRWSLSSLLCQTSAAPLSRTSQGFKDIIFLIILTAGLWEIVLIGRIIVFIGTSSLVVMDHVTAIPLLKSNCFSDKHSISEQIHLYI